MSAEKTAGGMRRLYRKAGKRASAAAEATAFARERVSARLVGLHVRSEIRARRFQQ